MPTLNFHSLYASYMYTVNTVMALALPRTLPMVLVDVAWYSQPSNPKELFDLTF